MDGIKPNLLEPGVRYFVSKSLKQCHEFKDKYTSFFFNIGILGIFILVLSLILLFKYKGRLTPQEKELKERKKQEYIISKLQTLSAYRTEQRKVSGDLITDLPSWDDHPEAVLLNKQRVLP